jgi:hypothetical protein
MSMDASIKAKLTWEEAITQFDAELSLFKDDDTLASERRKHVAHCSHEISYDDFVFLVFGPLKYGMYYSRNYKLNCSTDSTNASRDMLRKEIKKSLQTIYLHFQNSRNGQSIIMSATLSRLSLLQYFWGRDATRGKQSQLVTSSKLCTEHVCYTNNGSSQKEELQRSCLQKTQQT